MKSTRKFLGWFSTPPFFLCFLLILLVCHPVIYIGVKLGRHWYRRAQDLLNGLLVANLRLWGTRFDVTLSPMVPAPGKPVIVISNHQSMFDIPVIKWWLRRYFPRFVSKRELAKWIPSVSLVLREGWSALIDRSDARQAIGEIRRFAESVGAEGHAAVIFPEGTRARDGIMKKFKPAGVSTLLSKLPDAVVVPVAITGSWELMQYKCLPIPFGVRFGMRVLDPIDRSNRSDKEVVEEAERRIGAVIHGANYQAKSEFVAEKRQGDGQVKAGSGWL